MESAEPEVVRAVAGEPDVFATPGAGTEVERETTAKIGVSADPNLTPNADPILTPWITDLSHRV